VIRPTAIRYQQRKRYYRTQTNNWRVQPSSLPTNNRPTGALPVVSTPDTLLRTAPWPPG
jgi:hypothetical protein